MAKQTSIESLLAKNLGKDVAAAMVDKIDKMVKEGASASDIEKTLGQDLANHIENGVVSAVVAKIGPITPIKIKPIQADVKVKITPISTSVKIGPSISVKTGVKTGPGMYTRGGTR